MGVRRVAALAAVLLAGIGVALAWHLHDDHDATRAGAFVQPDPAAAAAATITGATPAEQRAARASLALVGADARGMRLAFTACRRTDRWCVRSRASRSLTITPPAPTVRAAFITTLAGRDASARLARSGERLTWRVATTFVRNEPVAPQRAVTRATLTDAARLIAMRAAGAGWTLAPIPLYTTTGGGMIVIVRFGDRALLEHHDDAFQSTLYGPAFRPPLYRTLLLIEGPGGVIEGGGARAVGALYGSSLDALAAAHAPSTPGWLTHGRTRLTVTIVREYRQRTVVRSIRCGAGSADTPRCARMFRERAVLFGPIQSDNTCLGEAGDQVRIRGTVAGVAIERSYDTCYGGDTAAWEQLLGIGR